MTDMYKRMSVLVSPKVTPLRPASKADYLRIIKIDKEGIDDKFATTFTSAEDWVSGAPFPFRGVTEENTCLLYRPLLFYEMDWMENWIKQSLKPKDYEINDYEVIFKEIKSKHGANKSYNLSDMVSMKIKGNTFGPNDARLDNMRRTFKQRNTSAPSARMRGGRRTYTGSGKQNLGSEIDIPESFADIDGKRVFEIDNPGSGMEYYHVDTDPILTIAAMMFAFVTMEPKIELIVTNVSHGTIDGVTNPMVPVPEGVTVVSTIQGLESRSNISAYLFYGLTKLWNHTRNVTRDNVFIEDVEYTGNGVMYTLFLKKWDICK